MARTIDHLIGSAAAAQQHGVDRATFNRWVKAGKIPTAHKMPGLTGARLFDPVKVTAHDPRRTAGVNSRTPAKVPAGAASRVRSD